MALDAVEDEVFRLLSKASRAKKIAYAVAGVIALTHGITVPEMIGMSQSVDSGKKTVDQMTSVYVELAGQVAELHAQLREAREACPP